MYDYCEAEVIQCNLSFKSRSFEFYISALEHASVGFDMCAHMINHMERN